MLKLVILIMSYISYTATQTYKTGDNSTITGCSSHCSADDSGLTCLNRSLEFYEHLLLAQMRHFVAVQLHIDQWHKRHKEHVRQNYTEIKEEVIAFLSAQLEPEDVIDEKTIATVVGVLLDRVEEGTEEITGRIPHFTCPLPCEYRYDIWRNVFIASMILNFLLVIAIVPFIISLIRSDAPEQLVR